MIYFQEFNCHVDQTSAVLVLTIILTSLFISTLIHEKMI